MTTARIEVPPKLVSVFTGESRYRGAYGGRGSGKTRTFALMSAVRAYAFAEAGVSGVILGCREFMNSLADSSMEEIKQAIRSVPWLNAYFEIGETYIRTRNGHVWYSFVGLRHNLDSVKGKARILIAWADEAETISETAWLKLIPTVREEGSEIWVTWNPERDGSPTDERFRKVPHDRIVQMNYYDNPWFPSVLDAERQADRTRLDDQTYAWIWEGAYRENSEAQVMAGKYRVDEFQPEGGWNGPYFGADWGFSTDPTTLVKTWIYGDTLYIEQEAYAVGCEITDTPELFDKIADSRKYTIRADNARPETISHVARAGFRIEPCTKWSGSVEDGIAFIRSFKEVVIHPRCRHTIEEARKYSYKVDRLTGDVLPDIIDKHNHCWDAIRYALGPLIKRKDPIGISLKRAY